MNDGSAGSTNTLGERGREKRPSPPLSWDWRPGGRKRYSPGHAEVARLRE